MRDFKQNRPNQRGQELIVDILALELRIKSHLDKNGIRRRSAVSGKGSVPHIHIFSKIWLFNSRKQLFRQDLQD